MIGRDSWQKEKGEEKRETKTMRNKENREGKRGMKTKPEKETQRKRER